MSERGFRYDGHSFLHFLKHAVNSGAPFVADFPLVFDFVRRFFLSWVKNVPNRVKKVPNRVKKVRAGLFFHRLGTFFT